MVYRQVFQQETRPPSLPLLSFLFVLSPYHNAYLLLKEDVKPKVK